MATIIAALAFACGCTTLETYGPDEQGYSWTKTGIAIPPENWLVEFVPADEVMLRCGLEPNAKACSVRRMTEDGEWFCYIYTPERGEKWYLPHEMRHCLGWTHAQRRW